MSKHKKLKNKLSRSQIEDRNQKRKNQLAAIILAALMVAGLAGIALSGLNNTGNKPDYSYNNYNFKLQAIEGTLQSLFVTEIDGKDVSFYSLPQDTLKLDVEGNLSFLRTTPQLVLTTTPGDNVMHLQDLLRFQLSENTGRTVIGGVMVPNENYTAYPLITCLNASSTVPVIELTDGNHTKIVVSENCIKIESLPGDVAYIRDRLLYQMLGVLN